MCDVFLFFFNIKEWYSPEILGLIKLIEPIETNDYQVRRPVYLI